VAVDTPSGLLLNLASLVCFCRSKIHYCNSHCFSSDWTDTFYWFMDLSLRKPICLEKDIVRGCVSGSRSRGRQRRTWTEDIVDWTGLDINTAARLTEDRYRWHHVLLTTNPPGERHRRRRRFVDLLGLLANMNEWACVRPRDLSRGCCMSIICLLIQFSFKSTTETSECKAHIANSQSGNEFQLQNYNTLLKYHQRLLVISVANYNLEIFRNIIFWSTLYKAL